MGEGPSVNPDVVTVCCQFTLAVRRDYCGNLGNPLVDDAKSNQHSQWRGRLLLWACAGGFPDGYASLARVRVSSVWFLGVGTTSLPVVERNQHLYCGRGFDPHRRHFFYLMVSQLVNIQSKD